MTTARFPHEIVASHTFTMGHRLPSYKGVCAAPHGHNVTVTATVQSTNFLDFKDVSNVLRRLLSDWDHAMILWNEDPFVKLLRQLPEARIVGLNYEPSTEVIAQYIFDSLCAEYWNTGEVHIARVHVQETAKYGAAVTRRSPSGEFVKRTI